MDSAQGSAEDADDGRRDFDFLLGKWVIANRKLRNPLDPHDKEWLEFEATSEERPILGGLGNLETYWAPQFPGRGPFEALAVRLFEPESGLRRIWWTSTSRPGVLELPMIGRFVKGRGQFDCDDLVNGQAVNGRFTWQRLTRWTARWTQAFSFDGGTTWVPNWVMDFSRLV